MADAPSSARLLNGFSLEMTGKDVAGLTEAAPALPAGTRVNVTFLGNENLELRTTAARTVSELGFVPVPHISARRIPSEQALEQFLAGLAQQRTIEHVFAVGGDPHEPQGPYADSLSLIRSGLLAGAGAREVSIAGYPEGHPDIDDAMLWAALSDKASALADQSLEGVIITQFGFDVAPVLAWAERVRALGIDYPIRVGVPGPAGVRRLLAFAGRFGVASSAGIARKYGFSLTNLLGTAGPDRFIEQLGAAHDPAKHGELALHFYSFGGVATTATWVRDFSGRS